MTLDTSDKGGGTLIVRDVMTENVLAVTAETPLKLVATRQGRPRVEHSARFGRSLAAGRRRYAEQRPSPQTITLAQLFASWDRAFDSAERAIRSAEQENQDRPSSATRWTHRSGRSHDSTLGLLTSWWSREMPVTGTRSPAGCKRFRPLR
jgi:hypothetical protein